MVLSAQGNLKNPGTSTQPARAGGIPPPTRVGTDFTGREPIPREPAQFDEVKLRFSIFEHYLNLYLSARPWEGERGTKLNWSGVRNAGGGIAELLDPIVKCVLDAVKHPELADLYDFVITKSGGQRLYVDQLSSDTVPDQSIFSHPPFDLQTGLLASSKRELGSNQYFRWFQFALKDGVRDPATYEQRLMASLQHKDQINADLERRVLNELGSRELGLAGAARLLQAATGLQIVPDTLLKADFTGLSYHPQAHDNTDRRFYLADLMGRNSQSRSEVLWQVEAARLPELYL